MSEITTTPSKISENPEPAKCVLILVGLVGSGKSTFAEALQNHLPSYVRCNQDDLGDRKAVEHKARQSLANGQSICIDRTNFDAAQRAHWITIGREFPGTNIWVIVFDTPYQVCAERLQHRTNHPTIKTPEQGMTVLRNFARQLTMPEAYEGHQRALYLRPQDTQVEYSKADLELVLNRVRDSPEIITVSPPVREQFQQSRGRGRSGYRGNSYRGDQSWNNQGRGRGRGGYEPRGGGYQPRGFSNSGNSAGSDLWRRGGGPLSHRPSGEQQTPPENGASPRGNHNMRGWSNNSSRGRGSPALQSGEIRQNAPQPAEPVQEPRPFHKGDGGSQELA